MQLSAHYTIARAEGGLERFIVKRALTFGAVGVRPSFLDLCETKRQVTEVHISLQTTPGAPFGGSQF